jgi:hypothetical protein
MFIIKRSINHKTVLKKTLSVFLFSILSICMVYFVFSPSIIMALSSTGTAIPTLTVSKEVNVTSPGTVTMGPSIPGITGNTSASLASGTATFTVQANSDSGFTMTLHASQANALATGAYNFSDYVPASAGVPDFAWQDPDAGSATFGFSIGADTADYADTKFKYATTTCNTGSLNSASSCFYGFNSTTPITVITTTGPTTGAGSAETVKFWAEFYNPTTTAILRSGVYTATITATISSN